MNVLLWIVQGVLAAMFIVAGVMKVSQPRQRLIDTMGWPADFSDNAVKGIGAVEILAAIGLILPAERRTGYAINRRSARSARPTADRPEGVRHEASDGRWR
jgi:uncharacterized membrane protein